MDLDLWELSLKHNINILGSNISSGNDITLTTTEGDVNILSLINQEYSQVQSVSQGLLSGEVNITGHSSQSIHQSNITSNNNLTINSGNNINILASNVNGVNGNLDANGNINILSMMLTETETNYHKEQSIDWGAVAVGAALAATGVGAVAGGMYLAGFTVSASMIGTAGVAGLVGAGMGAATQNGELDKYTTTNITHISSSLNFSNNLTISTEGNVNLIGSSIHANNQVDINLNGANSELIQIDVENSYNTTHEHEEMKPNYWTLGAGAFAYGIASGLVNWANNYFKPGYSPAVTDVTAGAGVTGVIFSQNNSEDENKPKPPLPTLPTIDTNGTLLEMTGEALHLAIHTIVNSSAYQLIGSQVWGQLPVNNLTAEQNAGLLILAQMLFPKPPIDTEEGNKPTGGGASISKPKPPIYNNNNGSFSLINNSVFDINAPLQSNIFHNHTKPTVNILVDEKEKVEATITGGTININKK